MPVATDPETLNELLLQDDEAFVRAAYTFVLGREVDPTGLTNFLLHLRQGQSKEQVIAALASSEEARTKGRVTPVLVKLLALQAPPPPCRLCNWVRRVLAGALEPLLQQLRAIDNRLYRLEMATLERPVAGPVAADLDKPPAAPARRVISLEYDSADQLFTALRRWVRASPEAAPLGKRPESANVARHDSRSA